MYTQRGTSYERSLDMMNTVSMRTKNNISKRISKFCGVSSSIGNMWDTSFVGTRETKMRKACPRTFPVDLMASFRQTLSVTRIAPATQ